MTFNSWEFLIFFPIVALLYFLLPRKAKWPMLLLASYFFYGLYQFSLLFLIIGTTIISWLSSSLIERTERPALKKLALALTLIVCLGVLFFYKYFDFLLGSIGGLIALFGGTPTKIELGLILPVGISFYTFQTLSYVIDVYRGNIKTEKNFFLYALFVSFFPQLVAGPIERPDNLIPQLKEPKSFNKENTVRGAKYMLLGFFKKICVADLLSVYVNSVYNSPSEATGLSVLLATVMFAFQIYCDFSGYTDIATGCAWIMNIRLMKNFDHPYSAGTVKEFWSRWHISLSTWFRDYLYIPLGGNRRGKARQILNLMIVFLVSGLWHGASWTFVIWGALHGIYQAIGTLTKPARDRLIEKVGLTQDSLLVVAIRRSMTFLLITFSWIFFRANSVSDAFLLIERLLCQWGSLTDAVSAMELTLTGALISVFSILTLILLDKMLVYGEDKRSSSVFVRNGAFISFIWVILFAWAFILSKDMTSTFIYFRF